jgi:hypothetical protein
MPYLNEYLELSKRNHLDITRKITMDFGPFNQKRVIGTCYSGEIDDNAQQTSYREIQIDPIFFKATDKLSKKFLLFHELSHCLCNRDHTYFHGKKYTSPELKSILKLLRSGQDIDSDGYYGDGCPVSIMAPVLPYYYCLNKYQDLYEREMFEDCKTK